METRIKKISGERDADEMIFSEAGSIIRNGGLVAFPTETVYGLGANALDPDACKKIYEAKGRPSDNPLIVHIADKDDLQKISTVLGEKTKALVDRFWPGPLTLILKRTDAIPDAVTGGLDTVAVRMPSHTTALGIIKASGTFIAAPSANISGRPSPTKARHVIGDLSGRIDMIVADDSVTIGLESTIIDMTTEPPAILRPGVVTPEQIKELIGDISVAGSAPAGAVVANGALPKAPGMKYRHYAPRAVLYIVEGDPGRAAEKINELVDMQAEKGKRAAVLSTDETRDLYRADIVLSLGSGADIAEIASNLFDRLREMDELNVDVIYSESFKRDNVGLAVMNRLLKAADNNIITS